MRDEFTIILISSTETSLNLAMAPGSSILDSNMLITVKAQREGEFHFSAACDERWKKQQPIKANCLANFLTASFAPLSKVFCKDRVFSLYGNSIKTSLYDSCLEILPTTRLGCLNFV